MKNLARAGNVVLIALIGCVFTPFVSGQQAPREDGQPPREGRRGGRDGFRGDRRGRDGPRTFTPEEREQFYDRTVDRYAERLTRTYELDEQQQVQVRSRLEEIKAEQRAYAEPRAQESESLRNQMRELRDSAQSGGQFDTQRSGEIGDRMRALWEGSPLMNSERVTGEVEKLLPPDQVERGRARRQSEASERDRRHEEMRRTWEQRRQQQDGGQPPMDREEMRRRWMERRQQESGQQAEQGQDPEAARRQWMERREGGRRQRRGQEEQQGQPQEAAGQPMDMQPQQPQQQRPPIVEDPIGPWERYVRDFVRRYRLDTPQQATVQSVLREMQERRLAYEQSRRTDFDMAQQIEDSERRQQRLTDLNQPVVRLFEDLKTRLERVPTADQKRAAGVFSSTTTQPVTPASRPAESATRPAAETDRGERDPASRAPDGRRSDRERSRRPNR